MKKLLLLFVVALAAAGCKQEYNNNTPPHVMLGQEIKFLGCSPEKTYVVVGYRERFEGPVQKVWRAHDYVVFTYINDLNEVKNGTVHFLSVLKE